MPLNPEIIATINEIATTFYERELRRHPKALALFRARGLSDETIAHWRLGYAPAGGGDLLKFLASSGWGESAAIEAGVAYGGDRGTIDFFRDRLMFPIGDADGKRIFGFGSRRMSDEDPSNPKYLNTTETILFKKHEIFYGMSNLPEAQSANQIYLVEGNFDMLGLWHAGVRNVAALCGTALTTEHLALLSPITEHIDLVLDADAAGKKGTLRSLQLEGASAFDMGVVELVGGKDPDEIVREDPGAWTKLTAGRVSRWEYLWKVTSLPFSKEYQASVDSRVAWKDAWCDLVRRQHSNPEEARKLLGRLEHRLHLPGGMLATEYLGLPELSPNVEEVSLSPHDDLILIALAANWASRQLVAPYLELGAITAAIRERWLREGHANLPARLRESQEALAPEAEELWRHSVRRAAPRIAARVRELTAQASNSANPADPARVAALAEMRALRASMSGG